MSPQGNVLGGWTPEQLNDLGIPYPPPRGWKQLLLKQMENKEKVLKLWLDDMVDDPTTTRALPNASWTAARSVNAAIRAIQEADVFEFASLDHDLGIYAYDGGDGIKLIDWMAEQNIWPSRGIRIHSSNTVGVRNMLRVIDAHGPYPPKFYGDYRGETGDWLNQMGGPLG